MKGSFVAAVAATAVLCAAGAANAGFTVHTSLASFNAATSAQGTDTYTGFSITGVTASPIVRSAGAYGYTASAANGFFGAGTVGDPWLSTNTATDSIVFSNFTGGASAFGGNFFDSNIAGAFAAGDIMITAVDSSGSVSQTIVGATTSSFLGFVSDGSLVSLTVAAVQPVSGFIWPTVDNFVLAQAIPAPGAAAMLGLGGMLAARRRR
ncbi:MAG: PEP-CTERM sorting domain-containing protein [Phycisphaeraceae bacterium]|nr:hypothetical protein [Phycisphaerales bacterium]MCB9844347.1 PEP-CTERM sorting domain-containing protein [Phycisphaeraceae bacterium]